MRAAENSLKALRGVTIKIDKIPNESVKPESS